MKNLKELKRVARETALNESVHVQITSRTEGETAQGKPFIEIEITDASGAEKLRVWEDAPAFKMLMDFPQMSKGTAVEVIAKWSVHPKYGLQASGPRFRALSADEMNVLFEGGSSIAAEIATRYEYLRGTFELMAMPEHPMSPLGLVCRRVLEDLRIPFCRAAAAHGVHHAWRGGLLAHTVSMLQLARDICANGHYPEITPEIVQAAILFHDCGKVYETDYQESGFALQPTLHGAMLGHIAIGFDLFMRTWQGIHEDREAILRDHTAHCILAHHGQKEWGSPIEPATPEAVVTHHIDMIDAGIEKLRNAYRASEEDGSETVKAVYPLKGELARPYNASASHARRRVASTLWIWREEDSSKGDSQNFHRQEYYEQEFVAALRACGIITENLSFEKLPRSVFETAFRRWGELRMACNGLPALTK